jgi:RHS repeat-associated protein
MDRARAPRNLSSPRAFAAGVSLALIGLAACHRTAPETGEAETSPGATALLSAWRGRGTATLLPTGAGARLRREQDGLRPEFVGLGNAAPARVRFPARATGQVRLEDAASGTRVGVTLVGGRDAAAEAADGYVIYRGAHLSGASLLHHALPEGTEDLLAFEARPGAAHVEYEIALEDGVSGLRLVSNTLEMVDSAGAPRLRVEAPFLVGADGTHTDALLAVAGCAVDTNPAGPWGRPVTAPGAARCTLQVSWPDENVQYPAILDPRWTTVTGTMAAARQDHVAVKLTNNKVLVATGRSSSTGTTGLATADLYDPATGTWATTGAMTGGRWSASATLLNTGKVLVAGGINGTASLSSNTGQLYDPVAGTWASGGNIGVRRHLHTATLLVNGSVLVAGGMTDGSLLSSAAIYDPIANSWSPVAASMGGPRYLHTAVRLSSSNSNFNNKVLIVGGTSGASSLPIVQMFNSSSLNWETTTSLGTGNERERHTATALATATGNVLITGGVRNGTTVQDARVFTIPATGSITSATWVSAGNMSSARRAHTATLLASGVLPSPQQVLVVGGSSATGVLNTAEVWTGGTTWTPTTVALPAAVYSHTATLLTSGQVLIAGGYNGAATVNVGRVYDSSFGLGCTANSQCTTGFCVDGVCCDTACNNNCDACNLPNLVGTCSPMPSGTSCRAATGACDVAEVCNGSSVTCPADALAPPTTTCRPAAPGGCDVAETCTGTSAACPADGFAAATTTCRPANGACDVAETCTGTSASCPGDGFATATTTCRPAVPGGCDVAETCTGTSGACPVDAFAPPTTTCRAAAGACDLAETCTGSSAACPVDGFAPAATTCRAAVPGGCDIAETCTGSSAACPSDGFAPATTVCRVKTGECDVAETCSGTSSACPSDATAANGTACDDHNPCTEFDACQGGSCQGPTPYACKAPGQCREAGTCNTAATISTTPPATADLIGWWHMDGDGQDATGGGHNLALEGNVVTTPGRFGKAMMFDGASCMTAPAWPEATMSGATGVTMMAWVNHGAAYTCPYSSAGRTIMGKGFDYSVGTWCGGNPGDGTQPGATMGLRMKDATAYGYGGPAGVIPGSNDWALVAVRWDNHGIAVYVNGQGVGGSVAEGLFDNLWSTFAVGCQVGLANQNSPRSNHYIGAIDEVLLYKRALSPAEITAYYNATDPCTHPTKSNTTACTDNNACTNGDMCTNGECVAGTPTVCTGADQCHNAGTCNPANGTCSAPANKPENTVCDDGVTCTVQDTCHAGVCDGPLSTFCAVPSWVGDAKQAGLLPSNYLTPELFEPIADAGDTVLNSPGASTLVTGLNSSGVISGITSNTPRPWIEFSPVAPFVADGTGQHLLPSPWTSGISYAGVINDAGEMPAYGQNANHKVQSALYHADRSYELLPTPESVLLNFATNTHGADGRPALYGQANARGARAGSMGVWHLDHDFTDAVGPSAFSPAGNITWVAGHPGAEAGGAAYFDGTTCPTAPAGEDIAIHNYDFSTGLTMMAWIKPDADLCPGSWRVILNGTSEYEMGVECKPDGTVGLTTHLRFFGGDWTRTAAVGSIPLGQWSHVAVTWDQKTLRSYVNATLVGSQSRPGLIVGPVSGQLASLGCNPIYGPSTSFKGAIDEVSAFRNGMGGDQIALFYRNVTNYPPLSSVVGIHRYQDGFLDAVLPAADAAYAPVVDYFWPNGVNDHGVITTVRSLASGAGTSAMIYDPQRGWIDLNGLLPIDSGWNLQIPFGVSNAGQVVGYGLHNGGRAGFRLDLNTREITDVGRDEGYFSDPAFYVYAGNVNAHGAVGGTLYDNIPFWPQRGFVYTDTLGFFDVNWLIDPRSKWTLTSAGINDNGVVVGVAKHQDGRFRAYRMALPMLPDHDQVACAGKAENETCDDHDPCTHDDKCVAHACSGTLVVCTASDQCHTAGVCNPANGTCSQPVVADGTTCADPSSCTQSETCQAGSCVPPANVPTILNRPVTVVGSLAGSQANAARINAAGQIVGVAATTNGNRAFLQARTGAASDLGLPSGFAAAGASSINDQGTVTGTLTATDGSSHVFRYTPANGINDLGAFGDGSDVVEPTGFSGIHGALAYDINSSLQIAGTFTSGGMLHGFRYTDGVGFEEVDSLVAGHPTSATAIAPDGTVFGSSWVLGTPTGTSGPERLGHAIMWNDALGPSIDLNVWYDVGGWTLYDVADVAGDYIVGTGNLNGQQKAYRLRRSSGVIDDMSGGWRGATYGAGVNASGDVVGYGSPDAANTQLVAYVHTERLGFKKLNDVIDTTGAWDLRVATSINDAQEITGWGVKGSQTLGFRVQIPTPEVAVCEARSNTCGPGGDTDAICLLNDGLVDMPDGTFVALFGFANAGASTTPAENDVYFATTGAADVVKVNNFSPAPPRVFAPGIHEGAFLPRLHAGERVTWRVNGEPVTAFASTDDPNVHHFQPVPIGTSGYGVYVQGTLITLKADTAAYAEIPQIDPAANLPLAPAVGDPFKGTLPGSLSISPSGAATYTVPIAIPPGVSGMAPSLSLVYNSQSSDGIAGQGWGLTGLSIISRCPRTRASDGYSRRVAVDDLATSAGAEGDGVCLDGVRLLEDKDKPGFYKTELTDFSTIQIHPNSSDATQTYFTVTSKTGITRYYGATENSRVVIPGIHKVLGVPFPAQQPVLWAVNKVVDTWGNYYELHYNDKEDGTAGSVLAEGLRVTRIKYTGHESCTDPKCTFESVEFTYDSRPDIRSVRFGATAIPQTRRLLGITTSVGSYSLGYKVDTPAGPSQQKPDYDPALPSRLTTIAFCPSGVDCSTQPSNLLSLEFGWEGGKYAWVPAPEYNPHVAGVGPLHDLDADGRPDQPGWRNTGMGWIRDTAMDIPTRTSDDDGNPVAVFADVDGDGALDIYSTEGGGHGNFPGESGTTTMPSVHYNRIQAGLGWSSGGDFGIPSSLIGGRLTFKGEERKIDMMADMDGDGRSDIVRFGPDERPIQVLHNGGDSSWQDVSSLYPWDNKATFTSHGIERDNDIMGYHLEDINRDGLPDIVKNDLGNSPPYPVMINRGVNPLATTQRPALVVGTFPGYPGGREMHAARVAGDIDGDGIYDVVLRDQLSTVVQGQRQTEGVRRIAFGTGSGFIDAVPTNTFAVSLFDFTPKDSALPLPHNYRKYDETYSMADLNGDGLADMIFGHMTPNGSEGTFLGGAAAFNTGREWVDPNLDVDPSTCPSSEPGCRWREDVIGRSPVPMLPSRFQEWDDRGAVMFVDLNGDGVADLLNKRAPDANDPTAPRAWLNQFQKPFITTFPNGVARPTEVHYVSIASAEAQSGNIYADGEKADPDRFFSARMTYLPVPMYVAASVRRDDGVGANTMAETKYFYTSLRGSPDGRGPQGFKKVTVIEPGDAVTAPTTTTTTYSQQYPFTGMPISAIREKKNLTKLSATYTDYCAALDGQTSCSPEGTVFGPGKTLFVHPKKVTDLANLLTGPSPPINTLGKVRTTTGFTYDEFGNPTDTVVTIEQVATNITVETVNPRHPGYQTKATHNTYGQDESHRRMGKLTLADVRSTIDGTALVEHIAASEYRIVNLDGVHSTLALVNTTTESGAGWPYETKTAYRYDRFGNVVQTTTCASDFTACEATPGVEVPAQLHISDPVQHPLFRTTTVSFNPADFHPGPGSVIATPLPYGEGRFPVMTTNPEGHTEYVAYDPIRGLVREKTGPNGLHTVYQYDEVSRLTTETTLSGTDRAQTTTFERRLAGAGSPGTSALVTVTIPPTNNRTWDYTDVLGRSVATILRGFDGTLIESTTTYDTLGRIHAITKPHFRDATGYQTSTEYDVVGRAWKTTQELGPIVDGGPPVESETSLRFAGLTTYTDRIVAGEPQTRKETKNTAGLAESIIDPGGGEITYSYDADGRLTGTTDPQNNTTGTIYFHGLPSLVSDPDLGNRYLLYGGYGEVYRQFDAKNQQVTMTHDRLGRVTSKTDASGTAYWLYDVGTGKGVGKLAAMVSAPDDKLTSRCGILPYDIPTDGNRVARWYAYDDYGNTLRESQCTDGETFMTGFEYDNLERQIAVHYPQVGDGQLTVGYHYSSLGHMQYAYDASSNRLLWAAKAADANGQVTQEVAGNGVETVSTRNPVNGWLLRGTSVSHADGNRLIQGWVNGFDEAGNLRRRSRADAVSSGGFEEVLGYDPLNRLTSSVLTNGAGPTSESYHYDALGNLTQKGSASFTYGASCEAGPHAICTTATGGAQFVYDLNGNVVSGNGRGVTVNPSNKVTQISNATAVVDFVYGADGNRVMQRTGTPGATEATGRTVYVGLGGTGRSLYERTTGPNGTEHVQFIYAGGAALAVRLASTDGTGRLQYNHVDHLGSITTMSDEDGRVVDSSIGGPDATVMGYDAWGARRQPNGETADPASFSLQPGHREFTGHETIPGVGLVNMNGRIYDPQIGRFLSPDPNIQFVDNLQSYNRYSYVLNNPLSFTDPTGYFLDGSINDYIGTIGKMAIGAVLCGASTAACAAWMAANFIIDSIAMAENGTLFTPALIMNVVGMGVGMAVGAGVGQGVGELISSEHELASGLVSGMISGSLSGAFMAAVSGGGPGDIGSSALDGAFSGAVSAAMGWGYKQYQYLCDAEAGTAAGEAARRAADRAGQGGGDEEDGTGGLRYRRRATGTTRGANGQAVYAVKWELDKPSPKGGFIIQHVRGSFDVFDAAGNPIRHPADDGRWDYWEAWRVNPGQKVTIYSPYVNADDFYGIQGAGPGTSGTWTIKGEVRFFEGMTTLPPGFAPGNANHAGILPSTVPSTVAAPVSPPVLPTRGVSPPVDHSYTNFW